MFYCWHVEKGDVIDYLSRVAKEAPPHMLYAKADLSNAAARLEQAFYERNAEGVAVLYADLAWALYPQPLAAVGREAIRQAWMNCFVRPDFYHRITIDEVVESEQGDLGYVFGRWWLDRPSAGLKLAGWYIAIWQPSGGAWEVTHMAAHTLSAPFCNIDLEV